jgi:uncharacterized coiled-coil DUF342 family protein
MSNKLSADEILKKHLYDWGLGVEDAVNEALQQSTSEIEEIRKEKDFWMNKHDEVLDRVTDRSNTILSQQKEIEELKKYSEVSKNIGNNKQKKLEERSEIIQSQYTRIKELEEGVKEIRDSYKNFGELSVNLSLSDAVEKCKEVTIANYKLAEELLSTP